ncbi:hypothetical protein M426DRAFT_232015 [Hypoxylon sp. CI-4A]|nr:hypothetical protein M426DRAFT_232015 [Hypoxylon sp. CI-4A]
MTSSVPLAGELCCAICGDAIPSPTPTLNEASRWQTSAILLSDPNREFEILKEHYRGGKRQDAPRLDMQITQGIRKDRARVIKGDLLQIAISEEINGTDAGHEVQANYSYGREENGTWFETPYYIATHEACLEVAEDVMGRSPNDIAVRDLRTLWKVLRMRFEVDDSYFISTITGPITRPQRIELPHDYYMPFRPSIATRDTLGESGAAINSEDETERWESTYPIHVPNLTSSILQNLNSLPPPTAPIPEALAFQKRFLSLPPELRDHICSFLASRAGMPSLCNGLLPQWVWREVVLPSGECLPFLRDLDISNVQEFCARWESEHKHGEEEEEEEPNWELLVRVLSQEAWGIWDAERSALDVPGGLRNRRRVWKLVEEMRVGDTAAEGCSMRFGGAGVGVGVDVPRYWDGRGGLVYPVVTTGMGFGRKPCILSPHF